MPLNIQMWPDEIIELNKELASGLHPELVQQMEDTIGPNYGHQDHFLDRIGCIAAYCGIILDGVFDQEQIVNICRLINQRLPSRRQRPDHGKPEIILPIT